MRIITIEGIDKKFNFPTDLSELSIEKFQEVSKVEPNANDELETYSKIISILSGIPEDTLESIPYSEFKKLIDYCQFLYKESINTEPNFEVVIGNEKYKFDTEVSKYSLRNYLDLDTIIKESKRHKLEVDNLPILMAMMYRKVDKKGKIEKYDHTIINERADIFKKHMNVDCALAAYFFSIALAKNCMEISLENLK